MNWRHPIIPWLAAILSGILLALCFPSFDRTGFIWFWQAPLLAVLWFFEPSSRTWRVTPLLSSKPRWHRIYLVPMRLVERAFNLPQDSPRWKLGLKLGYLTGLVFFIINIRWIHHVSTPGLIVLAGFLAIYFGIWGAFAASIGRIKLSILSPRQKDDLEARVTSRKLQKVMQDAKKQGIMAPSVHTIVISLACSGCWVACEWLRGIIFTGFGWNGVGVALHNSPVLAQAADLVGVTGLSFLPVFTTCIMLSTVVRFVIEAKSGTLRPHMDFAAAMLLIIVTFFYGYHSTQGHQAKETVKLNAVLIQGNIPVEQRWPFPQPGETHEQLIERYQRNSIAIYDHYEKLTSIYADKGYDLIVWPETSVPFQFFNDYTHRYLNSILAQTDSQLIFGNEMQMKREEGTPDDFYNTMVWLHGSTELRQTYHKVHLVPFGEYIPFRSFPLMEWLLGRLIPGNFSAGEEHKMIKLEDPNIDIIPSICFEDTIGRLTRKFIPETPSPQVILNITNDAWFRESNANIQHLVNAKFRCIELKRPMIRCANTGITCVIDEFGNLSSDPPALVDPQTNSPFIAGGFPIEVAVNVNPRMTIYAKYGDWFAIFWLWITMVAVAVPIVRYFRRET